MSKIGFNFNQGKRYHVGLSNHGWYHICLASEYKRDTLDGFEHGNYAELHSGEISSGIVDAWTIKELKLKAKKLLLNYLKISLNSR